MTFFKRGRILEAIFDLKYLHYEILNTLNTYLEIFRMTSAFLYHMTVTWHACTVILEDEFAMGKVYLIILRHLEHVLERVET